MINKVITAFSLVIVLSVSIFFVMMQLPMPEEETVSYRDLFESHTDSSDTYINEGNKVIISTEELVNVNESTTQETKTENRSNQNEKSSASLPVPSGIDRSYESFFESDDDIISEDYEKQVYVSVEGLGEEIADGYVTFESGDSVYDVTYDLLNKNGIKIGKRGGGSTLYIYKIGDLSEKDHGPMSGWIYTVNGDNVNAGCGSYKVSDGDVIDWRYQKD